MDMRHKSMKASGELLSSVNEQLTILNNSEGLPDFDSVYKKTGEEYLTAGKIGIFQINVGKMCNQVCKHCHVDAGPDRKEIMTRETMQLCLDVLKSFQIPIVDITGGAPELNPCFKWFINKIKNLDKQIMVRSNLTILDSTGFEDYAEFMAKNDIEIISSLPFYKAGLTDRQRGEGVFQKSIIVIKRLNSLGYGIENSGLILNLVYNPVGAYLPAKQQSLENEYKRELWNNYQVLFNNLYTITNMPISRFLDYLISSGNYQLYMEKLVNSFNPAAAMNVMCKNTLSVGWDGFLYDCDFNQMLELTLDHGAPNHIRDFDLNKIQFRRIVTGQHCFGCTAGAGSSCGGTVA
jgi:radical SAM/Cys-rich protein